MITKEVNKFMALAPLMLPRLIDSKKCAEPDITEDSAILYFSSIERDALKVTSPLTLPTVP